MNSISASTLLQLWSFDGQSQSRLFKPWILRCVFSIKDVIRHHFSGSVERQFNLWDMNKMKKIIESFKGLSLNLMKILVKYWVNLHWVFRMVNSSYTFFLAHEKSIPFSWQAWQLQLRWDIQTVSPCQIQEHLFSCRKNILDFHIIIYNRRKKE